MALWMVRTGLQPGQHYYHHQLPVDTITKQPLHQYSPYINLLKQFQQHTVCHSLPTNFYLCSSARYFYCTLVRALQFWLVLELRVWQSLNLETAINICLQNTFNNHFNFNQFQTFNCWDIWKELMELGKG